MNASAAREPGVWCGPARDVARTAILFIAALLLLLGVVLLWRRAVGALQSPLPVASLLAATALFTVLAAGLRLCWRAVNADVRSRAIAWGFGLLPTAAVLLLGVSLSLPGTSAVGVIALWGVIVLEETWSWRGLGRKRLTGTAKPTEPTPVASSDPEPVNTPKGPAAVPPDDDVLQHFTRSRDAAGTERLTGWLRATFAPGQRTDSVHLAFCPPFERTPRLAVDQAGGPRVRVKTAQLLPYGARLDLKLGAATVETQCVLLSFSAESPAPNKTA